MRADFSLKMQIDHLISMAYFCLSGDGLGVIWAEIGGQWPPVARRRWMSSTGRCLQHQSHSDTRYMPRIVSQKPVVRRAWRYNNMLSGTPSPIFWTFTYVYAVGSDETSLQGGWVANQKSDRGTLSQWEVGKVSPEYRLSSQPTSHHGSWHLG